MATRRAAGGPEALKRSAAKADVVVVGAGMAGLTAALRLAERGLKVVVVEQDAFIGGKWGAHRNPTATHDDGRPIYHEHCYHMFLNWFFNFWRIVDELGLRDEFEPHSSLHYLRKGEFPRFTDFRDVGSPGTVLHNVFSGVLPPADSFIYAYSLLDLLAEPIDADRFLDRFSVNAFMASRGYTTDAAAMHHQRTLAKAFACPSYRTSASTYKRFIKYGYRHPEPMMWILKGNCEEHFHQHMRRRLEKLGVEFFMLQRLHYMKERNKRIEALLFCELSDSPTIELDTTPVGDPYEIPLENSQDVVVAVPPGQLGKLINRHVGLVAPELANVRRLRSEPMASLDLYFKRKLEGLPKGHVVLLESPHDVTFIDNSQFWPNEDHTVLNVVASNTDPLNIEDANAIELDVKKMREWRYRQMRLSITRELKEFLPFSDGDVDWDRSAIQTNTGEELFVNETGTWQWRPETTCAIGNLFLAGDYCRHPIDVVTVESATFSGLLAAEAIRKRRGIGQAIEIIEPDAYPEGAMAALKLMGAPWAYAAKLWATAADEAQRQAER